ncbi:MAG TPA: DUF4783 domain-containing protein [Chitinophagaceae bacterium]|nr:DUF4783 domain-containing protein [Chitinophagaceae bacterium]
MKYLATFLMATSVVLLSSFTLQSSNIDAVIGALRSGNSSELGKYFDDNVELTVPDKSDNYSRAQAQLIVRDFFSNNGVKGFSLEHKGDSPGGHYCIGTLQTNAGKFRTNVFMKTRDGKEVIKDIRFQSIE